MDVGYWIGRGMPSSVDWCEPNYAITPWIAEFWNTSSSFVLVAAGVLGLVRWALAHDPLGRRFGLCFAGLAVVGLGSVAFHATLLKLPQALDELPMVYVGLLGTWCLRHRASARGEGRITAVAFVVYALLFTVAYAWFPAWFTLFIATYTAIVAYVALASMWLTWVQPAAPPKSGLLAAAAGGFLGAWALCWIPEHVLLACDHPLQDLQLHAWWHVGSAFGVYSWYLWAMADRFEARGQASRLERGFVVRVPREEGA